MSIDIVKQTFDFVVIGGGTSGLTVAARLAENPEKSVLVLEAGQDRSEDLAIAVPAQLGKQFGNPHYDWQFATTPQKNANGQVYAWPRGKLFGGSSGINFLLWTRPPAGDIDAWEELGNPGWNWSRYLEYSKKSENFIPPANEFGEKYQLLYNINSHGTGGPLSIGYAGMISAVDVPVKEAWRNFGFSPSRDPYGGDPMGYYSNISTIDPISHKRSFSSNAYYIPNKDKPNFKVLGGATVHRLITKGGDGDLLAEGVEFEHEGRIHVVSAKEVIISAGSLKTPQILELSGIGDQNILEPLGIRTKVHLPGVGENLQEHFWSQVIFEANPDSSLHTLDALGDEAFAAEQMKLFREKRESVYELAISCLAFVPLESILPESRVKEMIENQRHRIKERGNTLPAGLKEQYDIQLKVLDSKMAADVEITHIPGFVSNIAQPEPGKKYITIGPVINHPFSRGHVHISSSNPADQPTMNPNYFDDEFDLEILTECLKFARRMGDTEPLKSLIAKEAVPGPSCVTDEDFKLYAKEALSTAWHTTGTASMLPREKNGVVDNRLKVYGTENVRVVDISIVPLQIAAHTQATAYAIGEQAADIILGNI